MTQRNKILKPLSVWLACFVTVVSLYKSVTSATSFNAIELFLFVTSDE